MWAASSKSKELAVEEMQKTIMLEFSFDSKACAPGTDEVNQGFFCSTGAGCLHSAKSFTGTQSVLQFCWWKERLSAVFSAIPSSWFLSVLMQITRQPVYLHLFSIGTYLFRIYVYSVSPHITFKAMIASSRWCVMILLFLKSSYMKTSLDRALQLLFKKGLYCLQTMR